MIIFKINKNIMNVTKNIATLVAALGLSASAVFASGPTWKRAEYKDSQSSTVCSVSGTPCQIKTWRECNCLPCDTHPTDQAGKDGCDCGAIQNNPTQVSVFNGFCVTVFINNISGPRTPSPGSGVVFKYCSYPSTPAGALENKPGCNLDATPN
jgi:hypothetical protein